jgi:hypothetical protein
MKKLLLALIFTTVTFSCAEEEVAKNVSEFKFEKVTFNQALLKDVIIFVENQSGVKITLINNSNKKDLYIDIIEREQISLEHLLIKMALFCEKEHKVEILLCKDIRNEKTYYFELKDLPQSNKK